jgi:hypothetical protein
MALIEQSLDGLQQWEGISVAIDGAEMAEFYTTARGGDGLNALRSSESVHNGTRGVTVEAICDRHEFLSESRILSPKHSAQLSCGADDHGSRRTNRLLQAFGQAGAVR